MNNNISVVLLGAGSRRRFKSSQIKQNVIINKVSILNHSRLFFNKYFPESKIFIVSNSKVVINTLKNNENVIHGSSTRLKSLHVALENIFENNLQTKYTLIHDVARPILNIDDIKKLIASIKSNIDASTLGYPLTNALKDYKNNKILNSLYKDKSASTLRPKIYTTTKRDETLLESINNRYNISYET